MDIEGPDVVSKYLKNDWEFVNHCWSKILLYSFRTVWCIRYFNITGMFNIFIVLKDLLILWDCISSLQNRTEDRSLLATRSHLVIIIFISCMCFKVFIEKASDKLETCSSFREQWTYDLSVSAAVMVTLSTTTPLSSPQEKKDLSSWNSSWACWMSPSLASSTSIKSRVCPDENGLWILI